MSIELTKETYAPYEHKMERSLQVLQENLNAVRAGRANPRVLDRIHVNYYGADTPLNQVANVQVPEARMITIQPWEPKMLSEIEKAIQMSDLGINPTNDGKMIRLSFPMLTEERRRDLVKQVERYGEETKVAVRNVRRECIDLLKNHLKKKEISEDQLRGGEETIQKMTDRFITKIDQIISDKEKDLMEL